MSADPSSVPPPLATSSPSAPARQWAMFAHLSALLGVVLPIPFVNVLAPLVIWQMKKEEFAFVDEQGKEALNFQITVSIALLVCFLLVFVVIGFLLLPIVAIASLVFTIIAGIKANNGESYRYPITMRLVK